MARPAAQQTRRKARRPSVRFDHACPCGRCGGMLSARFLPGWDDCVPAEVRAIHEAARRRQLALWEVAVWRPERAERDAAYRRLLLATVRLAVACRALAARFWSRCLRAADVLPGPRLAVSTCLDRAPPLAMSATGGRYVIPP